jgi:hypothetical protein
VIRVTTFPGKATQKCADRRRGDGVVKLLVHFSVSPFS